MEPKIDIMPGRVVKYRKRKYIRVGPESFYIEFKAANSEHYRGISDETFNSEYEAIKALEEHRSGRAVFKAVRVHVGSSFFICSRKTNLNNNKP